MRWRRADTADGQGFNCAVCGQHHSEIPLAFHANAPINWLLDEGLERDQSSALTTDQCVIRGEEFYVRGLVQVPVRDDRRVFEWGVWVSLSQDNFIRMDEMWDVQGRESEPPVFGWLSTDLPGYSPRTVNLRTMVHAREVGLRPLVVLQPDEHPLAIEQREGITVGVLERRLGQLLHST